MLTWIQISVGEVMRRQNLGSINGASLVAQMAKNLPVIQETRVRSLGRKDLLEKGWQPTLAFLSGKSHGERSLVGYSPWGCKESDTTEQLTLSVSR